MKNRMCAFMRGRVCTIGAIFDDISSGASAKTKYNPEFEDSSYF